MEDRNFDFKKKVEKKFPQFVESIAGLNVGDLEKNLLIYSKHQQDTELARKLDTELQDAKETVKDLGGPYRDTLSALKMKLAYIHILMKEKDGDFDIEEQEELEANE